MVRYVVRYGAMRALGVFAPRGNDRYQRGTRVIARTNRGLEAGDVLCVADEDTVGRDQGRRAGPDPPRHDPRGHQ